MKFLPEPGMHYAYASTTDHLSLAFQTSLPLDDSTTTTTDPRRNERPCILLLHGFSGSSAYFTRNLPTLTQHHWVLAPDMRGHGASGHSTGGYHVSRLAADLRAILTQAGIVVSSSQPKIPVVAVGCSIGAAVLWAYTELFGDGDFAGFVFVDQAPLQHRAPPGWGAEFAHRGCFDEGTLEAAQRAWAGEEVGDAHRGLVRECLGYRFAPREGEQEVSQEQAAQDEAFFMGISALCDGKWLARLLADHSRYDHRETIEGITKPTMVIAGRRTGCFPLEGMKETVRRVVKGSGRPELAKWVVFESGHWMFYEEPERFNRELLAFVDECVAKAGS